MLWSIYDFFVDDEQLKWQKSWTMKSDAYPTTWGRWNEKGPRLNIETVFNDKGFPL